MRHIRPAKTKRYTKDALTCPHCKKTIFIQIGTLAVSEIEIKDAWIEKVMIEESEKDV